MKNHYTNLKDLKTKNYDLILILVGNKKIKNKEYLFLKLLKPNGLLFDIKNIFKNKSDFKL